MQDETIHENLFAQTSLRDHSQIQSFSKARCPECAHAVTLAKVLISPTPFHLTCVNCDAKVRVKGIGSTTTIIILLAALGLGMAVGYFLYQLYTAGLISFALMLVLLVIVALLVQLALGLLVINRGTFVALKKDSA